MSRYPVIKIVIDKRKIVVEREASRAFFRKNPENIELIRPEIVLSLSILIDKRFDRLFFENRNIDVPEELLKSEQ